MLTSHFNILKHTHTGKVRPHEHTSYLPLALLLLIVGFCLTMFTTMTPMPDSLENKPPLDALRSKGPTEAAVIKTPVEGQTFVQTPIVISGACTGGVLVEIFKNDIFAGSTICSTEGTFTLDIDLVTGQNALTAKVFDLRNQEGPPSPTITATYRPSLANPGAFVSQNLSENQLLINTDAVFRGTLPGPSVSVPIDLIGGHSPYAVNVQWGDSTNKIFSRPDTTTFQSAHTYAKAGTYQLSIQATDAEGRVAFLRVAVIVSGQSSFLTTTNTTPQKANLLLMLWPLYAAIFAMTASFWLGEWREKRLLAKHGLRIP